MTINFSAGDNVIVKRDYVNNSLSRLTPNPNLKRSISLLNLFKSESAEVLEVGTLDVFDRGFALIRSYIKVVPQDMQNPNYQRGAGVILYFDNDTLLNDSFEFSTAYLCDTCSVRVLNSSGLPISKFDVLRYTGFDATTQLPTVALASAAALTTNAVMGIAEEAIADGSEGSALVEGSVSGLDTSAFLVNETVFLSDTPGAYQSGSATTSSVVGRVHTVGLLGSISIRGELPFGEGTQGVTGGGGTWSVAAKGILAGATDGVIHTAVVGRSYVLVALNADTSASNMSAGDEDLVTLPEIQNGNPFIINTVAGSINQSDVGFEMVELGAAGGLQASAQSNVGGGGGTDTMELAYSRITGQFTATHTQGGDATNGVYVLFEKA
jgi:hypothetical protein